MSPAPVHATIRTDLIRHNVDVLRRNAQPAALMAVLKADAYGHGLRPVATLLQEVGVKAFAVARVHEAIALREAGIEGLILVLAPPTADQLSAYTTYALHASVTGTEVVELLCAASLSSPLSVHVKVDTGMHRLGLSWREAPQWWEQLQADASLRVDGVYTHLATANTPDHTLNDTQLRRFADTVDALVPAPAVVHVSNTDALFQLSERLPRTAQYVRTGLGLYGITSTPPSSGQQNSNELVPVLSLTARVVHLHTVPAGETVSYGAYWTASSDTCVATVGIGYGDGYPRAASGAAHVRIHNKIRPVVGTVCMDLCMVDLGSPNSTLAQQTEVGDPVVLFDAEGPTLHDVARWSNTIPYEVSCQLAPRVARRYLAPTVSSEADNGTI